MVVKNYDTPLTIVGGGEFSSANENVIGKHLNVLVKTTHLLVKE